MMRFAGRLALFSAILVSTPIVVAGQSVASGSLAGRVVDGTGVVVFDADVTLQKRGAGDLVSRVTGRSGTFSFGFLTPGEYDLRVEAVGFRPLQVLSVPVRPGNGVPLVVTLNEAAPPVVGVDSVAIPGAASERVRLGESRWLAALELDNLPDGDRKLEDLMSLTALASQGSGLEGLPASMLGLYVDGIRVAPVMLPGMQRDPLFGALVPRLGMSGLEVVRGNGESEWNSGGGVASVITRTAGSRAGVEGYADYTGGSLWSSSALSGDVPEHTSIRGGALVDLPIVNDSVLATFGVEVERVERPRPELFAAGALPTWVGQLGGIEEALVTPAVEMRDQMAAFGRVDWKLASDARVSVRANVASIAEGNGLPTGYPLVPGSVALADGRDFSAGATVQVPLSDVTRVEVKLGLTSSQRSYGGAASFPYSRIPELPVAVGSHPAIPAELSTTAFEIAPTGSFEVGDHAFKVGLGATIGSYDIDQSLGAGGDFVLGGALGSGVYSVTGGSSLRSDISSQTYSVFAQDSWNASPGLHLLFGVRADVDKLPEDDVRVSALFDSLFVGRSVAQQRQDTLSDVQSFGTRFSFVWDVGEENRTFVRGGAGLSYEPLDQALLHEWVLGDGRRTITTSVDGGTWPTAPSGGFGRPWLTLAGGESTALDVKRARSSRGHFGVTRSLGDGLALHIGAAYRKTEQLARRLDINLTPNPSGVDQFGRPVYGELLKRGASVSPGPSLNRRFPELAQVDFLVFDGWSEYRDFSLGLERRGAGSLHLFANYTLSKTEDNMIGWSNPDVNERRVPILDPEGRDDWSEGTSDFDVPHRLVAGFEYSVPSVTGLRLSGIYRFSSAAPFTARFRPGVDANGDGAFSNDPAYLGGVDLSAIGSEWDCVRSVSDGPVERNSCRGGTLQSFDLRLSYGLTRIGGQGLELVVDALNIIEPDFGVRDEALYLVDPLTSIARTGATSTVPLAPNPNFGDLSVFQTPGRIIRLGLRIVR